MLTRQCAVNPTIADGDADYFIRCGLADEDCQAKWHLTLRELLQRGDLARRSTHAWWQKNSHKTLLELRERPLRFPIEVHDTTIIQRPVHPKDLK